MQNFIQQNQQSARQVLATNPQLTKALFQVLTLFLCTGKYAGS
jgi:hypothetical protein